MNRTVRLGILAACAILLAGAVPATAQVFHATLSGASEADPVETLGRGVATFRVDGDQVHYRVVVANLTDVVGAHIHVAPEGENGPVVVNLMPQAGPGRAAGVIAEGTFDASALAGPLTGATLSDLLDRMKDGGAYVNVHTSAHPGGEIRGQISAAGRR